MTRRGDGWMWILPVALAGTAATAAAVLLGSSAQRRSPTDTGGAEPASPLLPVHDLVWFGSAPRGKHRRAGVPFRIREREADRCCCGHCKRWPPTTSPSSLGGRISQVRSIADMLKSGIHKPTRKRVYGLPWGHQYDKQTKITRWAATTEGLHASAVGWRFFEFAERLLKNQIALTRLRGRRVRRCRPRRTGTG